MSEPVMTIGFGGDPFGLDATVRDLVDRLRALLTPEDVRHGWNFRDAQVNIGEQIEWTATLIGPIATNVTRHYHLGGERDATLGPPIFQVITGEHGIMRASTADELLGACRQWLEAVR
jgi:hypothetical protein